MSTMGYYIDEAETSGRYFITFPRDPDCAPAGIQCNSLASLRRSIKSLRRNGYVRIVRGPLPRPLPRIKP